MTDGFPNDVKLNKKLTAVEEVQESGKTCFDQLQKERMQDALLIKSEADIPSAFDTLLKIPVFNKAVQAIKQAIDAGKWLPTEDGKGYELVAYVYLEECWLVTLSDAFFKKNWVLGFKYKQVFITPRNY